MNALDVKLPNLYDLIMPKKRKKKKTKTKQKKKKKWKYSKPKVLKVVNYQTGKRESLSLDRKRKALPPGLRRSKSGKLYWETRRNRTDLKGRKT